MKKLTTNKGVYGPYHEIEVMPDRYRCDGADLPLTVVGPGLVEEWDGPLPAPAIDAAAIAREIEDKLDDDLDVIAKSWGYKHADRLVGYVTNANAEWRAEAEAFIAGRTAWWETAKSIQNAWRPGDPIPSYESVRAQMPEIVRPVSQ